MPYQPSEEEEAARRRTAEEAAARGISVTELGVERSLIRFGAELGRMGEAERRERIAAQIESTNGYLVGFRKGEISDTLEHTEQLELELRYLERVVADEELAVKLSSDPEPVIAGLREAIGFEPRPLGPGLAAPQPVQLVELPTFEELRSGAEKSWEVDGPNSGGVEGWFLYQEKMWNWRSDWGGVEISPGISPAEFERFYRNSTNERIGWIFEYLDRRRRQ